MEKKQKDINVRKNRDNKARSGKEATSHQKTGKKIRYHGKRKHHIDKLNIKKGDNVIVITGPYKGVKGKVLKAFPQKKTVVVERVNFIKKHTKPTQQNQQGGIIEKEAPIHVSNVMLFNEKIGEVTKAVYKKVGENRIRICKKTGDEI